MTKLKNIVKIKILNNNNFILCPIIRPYFAENRISTELPKNRIRSNSDGFTQG
jgi:hypothetical protein